MTATLTGTAFTELEQISSPSRYVVGLICVEMRDICEVIYETALQPITVASNTCRNSAVKLQVKRGI